MPSPTQITSAQLNRLIGTPNCPVIVDVCIDVDFGDDPYLIPTSRRHPFPKIEELVPELTGQKVVVVCQKGLKLSEGAAAKLRCHGIDAQLLEGGMFAWRDHKRIRLPHAAIPNLVNGATLWVTRHRPKIDRIACPWLVRRFVDPKAQFLFVSPSSVLDVAEKFGATAFDIEGATFGHSKGKCTFDTMLDTFQLHCDPLDELAKIIRGADTDTLDLTPQSAGLSAVLLGLSRMYKDDLKQLEAGIPILDAFYRWARDAQSETHDWHGTQK